MSEHEKPNKKIENIEIFLQDRLVEGEKVLAQADIHNGIYWQTIAVGIIALLFFVFIAHELGIFLFLVTAIMALYAKARQSVYILVITDKRVLVRYGLLQMDVVDLHFDKLESVELEQMPTGMIMGYSRVAIMGTGNRYISIPYVANGRAIRKAYNEQVLNKKSD